MTHRLKLHLIIALVLLISTEGASIAGANEVFNVKDYGAVGDGKTVNTAAINKAIEAAVSAGGGTILFPSGEWMSGTILMKSNVTLKISPDATLLAAPGPVYGETLNALIWGDGLENITITGGGVIEGKIGLTRDPGPAGTGRRIIALQRCKNLKITNVSLRHGAHTTLHLRSVDGIELGNMKVESFWDRDPNGGGDGRDGAIFDGCRNVHVYDSVFKGSDDAFSFKARESGFGTVSENFKIERCTFASRSSNAIQFGSETLADFRNIEIVDAKIEHAGKAGIGITMNDGAVIENVRYKNVEIRNACAPIFIQIRDRNGVGKIRNVRFDNITAPVISSIPKYKKRSPHGYWVATISGLEKQPVENIVFNNLTLIYPGGINETADKIAPPYPPLDYQPRKMGMRPASGFYIRHARDIEFHNLKIVHEKPDMRPAIVADSAEGILIDGAILPKSDGAECHVLVRGGKDVELRNGELVVKKASAPNIVELTRDKNRDDRNEMDVSTMDDNGIALSQVPEKMQNKDNASVSQLQIYESPATARKSGKFKVAVNGRSVFVEQLPVEEGDLRYKFSGCEALSYHCARFAFDGQAKVRVTVDGGADGFQLRPASAGIQTKIDGSTVELIMTEPRNLMLESGLTWLYIFADPLKNDAPQLDELKEADFKGDMDIKILLDQQDRKVVNIMNYGVDPSGEKLNTREIQKAIIDTAVGPYPGGTLYFPSGVYKTGSLRLYSGVTLYLADGALIQGSKNPADYPLPFGVEHGPPNRDYGYDYALIKIHQCENVAIRGRGTIDAGGAANGRLKIIHVENSRNVTVEDVVVRNTIGWMFPILHSENVMVKNARVISPITSNTDGINPDSSINVTLDGNFIVSGDDSVAVKATNFGMWLRDEIKNIRVVNNVLLTMKSSLKIGTETQSRHIHDIVFENNDILMADRAFTIYLRDGALIENVTFRNNRVEMAGGLRDDRSKIIDIGISTRDEDIWRNPRFNEAMENPGNIRNVLFENITVGTKESRFLEPSKISGRDRDNAVSNIVFRNLKVNGQKVMAPSVSILVGDTGKAIRFMVISADTTRNIVFE